MKKLLLIAGLVSLNFVVAFALTLPKPIGYVTDNERILSEATKVSLENKLSAFNASTSNEIAVVIISKLENETIESAAVSLFKKWGIGKEKKDNGVLLLISIEDRVMRIEVGYGLEGALTDILSGQIIRNEITPFFKKGDYNSGVTAGVDAIIKATEGEYVGTPNKSDNGNGGMPIQAIIILIVIIGQAIWAIFASSKSWWLGGVVGGIAGGIVGFILFFNTTSAVISAVVLGIIGLIFDFVASKYGTSVFGKGKGGGGFVTGFGSGGGFSGSSSGGSSFGGFSGGSSGGGGASGRW